MAVDADAPEQMTEAADESGQNVEHIPTQPGATTRRTQLGLRRPLILGVAVLLVLGGLFGWLAYRDHTTRQTEKQNNEFLQVGRQAALNLTTIGADTAETDVARILDSATGAFHDDWAQRAPSFVEVVKKANSKTSGSVTAAGLESVAAGKARVLVAVSVKTTLAGAPEQQPRAWRMRIDVQKVGSDVKVADVEFVP